MTQTRDPRTGALFDDGAQHVTQAALLAGERNPGESNQYGVGVDECNATILSVDTAVAVSTGNAALVFGVLIITEGTTATIVGLNDENDTAQSIVIKHGSTANVGSMFFDLKGMKVNATFTVQASIVDDVVVFWRPQG